MRRRNQEGSDDDSSEDEHVIEEPVIDFGGEDDRQEEEDDEEAFFENSQELTQPIPRKSDSYANFREESQSPAKKKKKRKEKESRMFEGSSRPSIGYRVREMDVSEIPDHIIAHMKRIVPKESDHSEGLSVEAVQKAASSSKGGVWIIKCPQDVSLSDLLPGKKLSLDGEQSIIDTEDDDSAQLTQFMPTDSLGANVKGRQFEATSVVNDDYKGGAVLILPDADRFKLVATAIQGHIIIRECVQELQLPQIKTPKVKARKLPEGIKERHPVYGADFTKIVHEMESAPKKKKKSFEPSTCQEYSNGFAHNFPLITPKIEIESDDSSLRKRKKKKKRDSEYDNGIYTHENGFDNSLDEDSSSRKKKSKKRKRDEELEESFNDLDKTVLIEDNEPAPKKLKKSKHRSRQES